MKRKHHHEKEPLDLYLVIVIAVMLFTRLFI